MGMARYFYLYSRFAFQACWLANVCWHWNFLYKINQIFFFKSHDVCCVSALGQNSCIGGIRYKFTTFNSLQKPNLWICLIKVFMALPKFILTLDIIGGILPLLNSSILSAWLSIWNIQPCWIELWKGPFKKVYSLRGGVRNFILWVQFP